MKTRRNTRHEDTEFLRKLARVDWLRAMQRFSVFLRDMRGDDPMDIQADHAKELERSQKLRDAAARFADSVLDSQRRKPSHQ